MNGRELKAYERFKAQAQFYRARAYDLQADLRVLGLAHYRANQTISDLRKRVVTLEAENTLLQQRVEELTLASKQNPAANAASAPLVKASVVPRRRKRPGRKAGHPAALRAMPEHIDVHQQVPLPEDTAGRESCPHCRSCLIDVEARERVVEDIIPAKVVVTCYHTRSGFCPCCRKQVESRAPQQPPAANLPHAQLGLNVLATGMVLRIAQRLPFRQVTAVFENLQALSLSPATISRQMQRTASWLGGDYEKLILQMRCAPHVHADETGWRTDGNNGYLWALTSADATVYHMDQSRSGEVIQKLLGKAFGGTLISDFYSAYAKMNCSKQKCLVHLLRELAESAQKSPAFAATAFYQEARRLTKRMLRLKQQWQALGDQRYFQRVGYLERQLQKLVSARDEEPNARRIARRMHKHQKELTAFLYDKDLDGTNNAAERAIRPAVVARKISGGSRSKAGADSWATLASLLRSAGQQGHNLMVTLRSMLMAQWASNNPSVLTAGP